MVNIEKYGNTTNGTIPLCLWEWESKLKKGDNLILAASTHVGEDEIIAETFTKLKKEFDNLKLVVVPRHPERSKRIK